MTTMNRQLLILIFLFALTVTPVFADDYQDGQDAFERGDYLTALNEFQALAEGNDARGQYGLAIMHDLGGGVPQNSEEAPVRRS